MSKQMEQRFMSSEAVFKLTVFAALSAAIAVAWYRDYSVATRRISRLEHQKVILNQQVTSTRVDGTSVASFGNMAFRFPYIVQLVEGQRMSIVSWGDGRYIACDSNPREVAAMSGGKFPHPITTVEARCYEVRPDAGAERAIYETFARISPSSLSANSDEDVKLIKNIYQTRESSGLSVD